MSKGLSVSARAGSHDPTITFQRTVAESVRQSLVAVQNNPNIVVATSVTAVTATTVPWAGVTGTPTTLAGYGITSPLDAAEGGTGHATYAVGDLVYASGIAALARLPVGTASQFLRVNAGATAPEWASGAALTKTDDTNVTLTLGGSPTTALLAATSVAVGWTGQLSVARGGTSFGSYTTGDIVYATGATAFSKLGIGATNTVMVSTGSAPSWAAQSTLTAPAGLLTGTTLASNVVTSSLTTIGTLIAGQVNAQFVTSGTFGSTTSDTGTYAFSHAVTVAGVLSANGSLAATLTGAATQIVGTFANNQAAVGGVGVEVNWQGIGGVRQVALTSAWDGAATTDAGLTIYTRKANAMTAVLTLASTGAATFAGAVSGGAFTTGLINGQTISSAANFTGSVAVGTTLGVTGLATLSAGASIGGANSLAFPAATTDQILFGATNRGRLRYLTASDTMQVITAAGLAAAFDATGGLSVSAAFSATSGTFSGDIAMNNNFITIPNGAYFRARRNSGSAAINVLGMLAGTDDLAMITSGVFRLRNTGNVDLFTVDPTGPAIAVLGTLAVTSDFSVNTSKFTVAASSGNMTSAGLTTTYNGVATAGHGVAAVRGYGRLTAQTAAVTLCTFSPASDGSFVVSGNLLITVSTNFIFSVAVSYKDESNVSRTLVLGLSPDGGGVVQYAATNSSGAIAYGGVPVCIRAKGGTTITVATSGTFTTVTYNAEAIITQVD